MATFNGNDLVLAIDETSGSEVKFAHAQNCSISFSNALIDTTTKDSDSWAEMITGRRSFTLSTSGLADFDDVASSQSTEQFSDLARNGTQIFFTFQRSATGLSSGDMTGWSGRGFIESFEVSAESDAAVTFSVSITGSGELSKSTVA